MMQSPLARISVPLLMASSLLLPNCSNGVLVAPTSDTMGGDASIGGSQPDASFPDDGGAKGDASLGADATISYDAAPPGKPDAAPAADASATADAALWTDASSASDGGPSSDAAPLLDASAQQQCLTSKCLTELVSCELDTECANWTSCIRACGNDMVLCPSICGTYYQSPKISSFLSCANKNACVQTDYAAEPPCVSPPTPLHSLSNSAGAWWVAGIKGQSYVLMDGCQKLTFNLADGGAMTVVNSVILTLDAGTRTCVQDGTVTSRADGTIAIAYPSYGTSFETWSVVYESPNAILAHICYGDGTGCMDYGTFVLAHAPLTTLPASEQSALGAALAQSFQLTIADLTPVPITGCANQ